MATGANARPIIIKRIKKGGHGGHHGGAWKVAYADFVTAMMAFFLVMWLVGQSKAIKAGVLALHKGCAPAIAVEFARRIIPEESRPTFEETEALCRSARSESQAAAA